jgi:hypothetical protein
VAVSRLSIDRCDIEAVESLLEALVEELTREVDSMQSLLSYMRKSVAVRIRVDRNQRVVLGKITKAYTYSIYPGIVPSHRSAANQHRRKTVCRGCPVSILLTPYVLESAKRQIKILYAVRGLASGTIYAVRPGQDYSPYSTRWSFSSYRCLPRAENMGIWRDCAG